MDGDDVVGIATIEDVLEEAIQEQIVDETDIYEDVQREIRRVRRDMLKRLSVLAGNEVLSALDGGSAGAAAQAPGRAFSTMSAKRAGPRRAPSTRSLQQTMPRRPRPKADSTVVQVEAGAGAAGEPGERDALLGGIN